jgi:hypothetical protein
VLARHFPYYVLSLRTVIKHLANTAMSRIHKVKLITMIIIISIHGGLVPNQNWNQYVTSALALREKLALVTGVDCLGNGRCARYRSSVTNKPRKVTGRCPLLITHIRNRHKITIVTTTSHRSREMVVSLAPQRTLVTGTKKPVTGTQHQRRVLWNFVSDVSMK